MSTPTSDRIYVWVWLPETETPIPAGVLYTLGDGLAFRYADSYRENQNAMSLGPDMPVSDAEFPPTAGIGAPGPIRDAAPDAWGRRVILNRLTGVRGRDADITDLTESVYLLASGSNRLGATDFQESSAHYVPRTDHASLDDLHRAAEYVAAGEPLPPELHVALLGGTTIGGARPKAVLRDGDDEWIAKFSASDDPYSVVGAEAVGFELARRVGLRVPETRVVQSLGKSVLLSRRFDRPGFRRRRHVVSGLTLLGLGEMTARHGTYPDLLDVLRLRAADPGTVGSELFMRIAFAIAISNTDDHLRNHAAFWDGKALELTPAYDLSPMNRSGETATQAIAYGREQQRVSDLAQLVAVAHEYDLSAREARLMVQHLIDTIRDEWIDAAEVAQLTRFDREFLYGRQILNPGAVRAFESVQVAPGKPQAR